MNRYLAITIATIMGLLGGFSYAQTTSTATLLPNAIQWFMDNNGKPLANGKVFFYVPGTTNPKTTWTTSSESVAQPNPVPLGISGRPANPIYGDGIYRQVVKDQFDQVIWDYTTSSTGAGGGGGGGGTATGDGDLVGTLKPWAGLTAPNQYMLAYGQAISRTGFPALFTAITSTQVIFCSAGSATLAGFSDTTNFPIGAAVEASCLPTNASTIISKTITTITVSANATINTSTSSIVFPWGNGDHSSTFNVPDMRGAVPAGNNNMGGTAGPRMTTLYYGVDPNSLGAAGGNQSAILTTPNLPPYVPGGDITNGTITVTLNFLGTPQVIDSSVAGAGNFASGSFSSPTLASRFAPSSVSQLTSTFVGHDQGGTSTAFSIVQPSITTNYIIKVTPDSNSATVSGVTSLGMMTGDIACGSGLLCTGNVISSAGSSAGGANGQIQYNNLGGFAGFTAVGDCTIVPSTGQVTCTKTNGVAFGAPATGTASGGTNVFATTSGTLGSGNCAQFDASGNVIDSGAPCSAGPTPVTCTVGTGGTYATIALALATCSSNSIIQVISNQTVSANIAIAGSGIRLTCNQGSTISVTASTRFTVTGNYFTADNCKYIGPGKAVTNSLQLFVFDGNSYVKFSNNEVTQFGTTGSTNSGQGIVEWVVSNHVIAENNYFHDNGDISMSVQPGANVVDDYVFNKNSMGSLLIFPSNNFAMTNLRVADNLFHAGDFIGPLGICAWLGNVTNTTFTGNDCTLVANIQAGVGGTYSFGNMISSTITGNTLLLNGFVYEDYSFEFNGMIETTITGNIGAATFAHGQGFICESCNHVTFTGNKQNGWKSTSAGFAFIETNNAFSAQDGLTITGNVATADPNALSITGISINALAGSRSNTDFTVMGNVLSGVVTTSGTSGIFVGRTGGSGAISSLQLGPNSIRAFGTGVTIGTGVSTYCYASGANYAVVPNTGVTSTCN